MLHQGRKSKRLWTTGNHFQIVIMLLFTFPVLPPGEQVASLRRKGIDSAQRLSSGCEHSKSRRSNSSRYNFSRKEANDPKFFSSTAIGVFPFFFAHLPRLHTLNLSTSGISRWNSTDGIFVCFFHSITERNGFHMYVLNGDSLLCNICIHTAFCTTTVQREKWHPVYTTTFWVFSFLVDFSFPFVDSNENKKEMLRITIEDVSIYWSRVPG